MLIIPAIDISEGECVRLVQGDFARRSAYHVQPAEAARRFADAGFTRLHVVDLDGALLGAVTNLEAIASIAAVPGIRIQVGGGVRSLASLTRLVDLGVDRVLLGSVAVRTPAVLARWFDAVDPLRVAAALDLRGDNAEVAGWTETARCTAAEFVRSMHGIGIGTIVCTDIARDGMLDGPNVELYAGLVRRHPDIDFIASGGVASVADLDALAALGLRGVVVGKALYEGRLSPQEAVEWMRARAGGRR